MTLALIVIGVILIILFMYWTSVPGPEAVYHQIGGHEDTPQIRAAVRTLQARPQKTAMDYLMLADMNRYNTGDQGAADENYALALQQAEYEDTALVFHINDRMGADVPMMGPVPPQNAVVITDGQNVHDTNVGRQLMDRWAVIREGQPATPTMIEEFHRTCGPDAQEVIDRILSKPAYMGSIGVTDADVLQQVIGRGPHVWAPLRTNLADCVMNTDLVCTTGRVSRIMDSLTLVDAEAGRPFVTEAILRKEMVGHAANYINQLSPERHAAYEADDAVAAEIGQEIERNLRQQYDAITDPAVMNKLIAEIKAGF